MKELSQICKKYWRQIIVILSLTLLCAFFSCCKKKTLTPDPIPTCETGKVLFAGVYENISFTSKGGFTIELLHNNCPTQNSNTYLIKGFSEAVKTYSAANQPLFAQSSYTLTSDETISRATNEIEKITLVISNNVVEVSSPRLSKQIKYTK